MESTVSVQPNRRGCCRESTCAQLCLPVHGSHRGTNLWSLHESNTRFVKRYITYIDDIAGEKRSKILLHVTFVNGFYPSLKFNWSISDEQPPFLDLVLIPTTLDRLLYTSVHYKPTDTHISFMYPRTPLVVKKPSSTVSFSAYGASAVTRVLL